MGNARQDAITAELFDGASSYDLLWPKAKDRVDRRIAFEDDRSPAGAAFHSISDAARALTAQFNMIGAARDRR